MVLMQQLIGWGWGPVKCCSAPAKNGAQAVPAGPLTAAASDNDQANPPTTSPFS